MRRTRREGGERDALCRPLLHAGTSVPCVVGPERCRATPAHSCRLRGREKSTGWSYYPVHLQRPRPRPTNIAGHAAPTRQQHLHLHDHVGAVVVGSHAVQLQGGGVCGAREAWAWEAGNFNGSLLAFAPARDGILSPPNMYCNSTRPHTPRHPPAWPHDALGSRCLLPRSAHQGRLAPPSSGPVWRLRPSDCSSGAV